MSIADELTAFSQANVDAWIADGVADVVGFLREIGPEIKDVNADQPRAYTHREYSALIFTMGMIAGKLGIFNDGYSEALQLLEKRIATLEAERAA